MVMFVDYGISKNCKNLMETYGEICVKCGKCKRVFKKGLLFYDPDKQVIKDYIEFRKKRALKNKKDK